MTSLPSSHPSHHPFVAAYDKRPGSHPDTVDRHRQPPIALWQLANRDDDAGTDPIAQFASRLARQLVLIYSRRGHVVLDFDDDAHMRVAANAVGRRYLAITDARDIASLDELHASQQHIDLVTMQWPPTAKLDASPSTTTASTADLFLACQLMTVGAATIIVADTTTSTARTFDTAQQQLNAAAEAAGFMHTTTILAAGTAEHSDTFQYYATPTEAAHTAHSTAATTAHLIVFTPWRRWRTGRARQRPADRSTGAAPPA